MILIEVKTTISIVPEKVFDENINETLNEKSSFFGQFFGMFATPLEIKGCQ